MNKGFLHFSMFIGVKKDPVTQKHWRTAASASESSRGGMAEAGGREFITKGSHSLRKMKTLGILRMS